MHLLLGCFFFSVVEYFVESTYALNHLFMFSLFIVWPVLSMKNHFKLYFCFDFLSPKILIEMIEHENGMVCKFRRNDARPVEHLVVVGECHHLRIQFQVNNCLWFDISLWILCLCLSVSTFAFSHQFRIQCSFSNMLNGFPQTMT